METHTLKNRSRSRSITRNSSSIPKSRSPSKGPEWQRMFTRDGRVYFANNVTQETSWLHPRTGKPELTGNFDYDLLPVGWEAARTSDGNSIYFINHNNKTTFLKHPVTGHVHETPNDKKLTVSGLIRSEVEGNSKKIQKLQSKLRQSRSVSPTRSVRFQDTAGTSRIPFHGIKSKTTTFGNNLSVNPSHNSPLQNSLLKKSQSSSNTLNPRNSKLNSSTLNSQILNPHTLNPTLNSLQTTQNTFKNYIHVQTQIFNRNNTKSNNSNSFKTKYVKSKFGFKSSSESAYLSSDENNSYKSTWSKQFAVCTGSLFSLFKDLTELQLLERLDLSQYVLSTSYIENEVVMVLNNKNGIDLKTYYLKGENKQKTRKWIEFVHRRCAESRVKILSVTPTDEILENYAEYCRNCLIHGACTSTQLHR